MIKLSHWPLASEVKFRKDFHISYSIFHIHSSRSSDYVICNMEYEI
jgi:hypothetical protein